MGLDPVEVRAVLDAGTHVAAVREDEDEARQLGITGVPFFVIDERYGLAGAQPPEQLLAALEQAWPSGPLPSNPRRATADLRALTIRR